MNTWREITEKVYVPFFETIARGYNFEVGHLEPLSGQCLVDLIWVPSEGRVPEGKIKKFFPCRMRIGVEWYIVRGIEQLGHHQNQKDGSWCLRITLRAEAEEDRPSQKSSFLPGETSGAGKVISLVDRA